MGRKDVSVLDLMCKDKYAVANNHKAARDRFSADAKNWTIKRDLYRERSKQEYAEAQGRFAHSGEHRLGDTVVILAQYPVAEIGQ